MTRNEFVAIITNFNKLSDTIDKYFVSQEESDDGNFVTDMDIRDDNIEVTIDNWKNPDWSERRVVPIEKFLEWYNNRAQ